MLPEKQTWAPGGITLKSECSQNGTPAHRCSFVTVVHSARPIESVAQAAFGGCFQWVLDAACEAVERLSAARVRVPRPPCARPNQFPCYRATSELFWYCFAGGASAPVHGPGWVRGFCFADSKPPPKRSLDGAPFRVKWTRWSGPPTGRRSPALVPQPPALAKNRQVAGHPANGAPSGS